MALMPTALQQSESDDRLSSASASVDSSLLGETVPYAAAVSDAKTHSVPLAAAAEPVLRAARPNVNNQAPWVGRGSEIRQLQRWMALARAGQPRSVVILGDEGTGKTALVNRIIEGLQRQDSPVPHRGTVVSLSVSILSALSAGDLPVTPESMVTTLEGQMVAIAQEGIRQTRQHINDVLSEAQINWSEETFYQAFSLIHPAAREEDVCQALEALINQSIPMLKRWRVPVSSVSLEITRLLRHPWVQACQAIVQSESAQEPSPSIRLEQASTRIEKTSAHNPSESAVGSQPQATKTLPQDEDEMSILVDPAVIAIEESRLNATSPSGPIASGQSSSRHGAPITDAALPDSPLHRQVGRFMARFLSLMQVAQHIDGMVFL